MLQLDLFENNESHFLYTEIEKMRSSLDRQRKAMFAILTELQDEILKLKEKDGRNN